MSREGALVKNTVILAIGTFFPKLAIFITLPVLTAFLTQEEYGTYDLTLTLVSLILPAATLQIQSAAFRFLIDVRHDDSEKRGNHNQYIWLHYSNFFYGVSYYVSIYEWNADSY